MDTAWHTPGMGRPCCVEVGESNAPVPQNRIRLSFPALSFSNSSPQSVIALQPQPDPPQCTSCMVLSNTSVPQSVSFPPKFIPSRRASSKSTSLPNCPRSPVTIKSKSSELVFMSSKCARMVAYAAGDNVKDRP